MKLTSPAFEDQETMPAKYAKPAENINFPLSWENPPAGTKSFALSVVDLHPVARKFVHWMVVDIPADATSLDEAASGSSMPAGTKELKPYVGPNPPGGTHDYEVTLYALGSETAGLSGKTTLDKFVETVEPQAIGKITLTGKYTKIKK
ncbi:YbhB/YbcL family Raf kinase inhibitor-like protein [Dactylosporangium sp. NPDC051485]|uniref:YbhB/YbcL family Raf kinase inhibitor-like protein n=1 Tax=Dactylosporangium sp. NPDC051485 TaxID=3154846 RepID=UPI00342CD13C